MNKIIKYTLVVSLVVFVAGCGLMTPATPSAQPKHKVSAEEDFYALVALHAEQGKSYKEAAKIFETLYKKTNNKEYLYRSLENSIVAKEYDDALKHIADVTKGGFEDKRLVRLKVVALIESKQLLEAQKTALVLVEKTKEPQDYELVGDIYVQLAEYESALQYYTQGYEIDFSEHFVNKIAIVYYAQMHQLQKAIDTLETHISGHGCSKVVCERLLALYSKQNNLDGILKTYKKLYSLEKNPEIAQKIIQIYGYKKDYLSLISFLEHDYSDDEMLLQLYSVVKNYPKAYKLAGKLYKETGDIHFLAQNAIFEYEIKGNKSANELVKRVIEKLKKVVEEDPSPVYKNYLGYIMIDHNLNVKKGMSYIREVLKVQPDSSFYLDSLAWGYYRLGNCTKAHKIMNKVVKMKGGDEPEVQSHVKKINQCLVKKRKK